METNSRLLLTFLLNASWQVALITALAACSARLLRAAPARCQHWIWVIALVCSWCLPLLAASRSVPGILPSEPPLAQMAAQPVIAGPAPGPPRLLSGVPVSISTRAKGTSPVIPINRKIAMVVSILYLIFLGHRTIRLLIAWKKTRLLIRGAYPVEISEPIRMIVDQCQAILRVKRIRLLCSTSVPAPITVGGLSPIIILPEQLLREAKTDLLISAIGHELSHVLRRDYLMNLIYEVIYLALSFHPAAALVRRRIKETRELCCDELVTERLLDATVYARALVQLAGAAVTQSRSTTMTIGIIDAGILEERIMTLLRKPKISMRKRNVLMLAAALVFTAPCVIAAPFVLRVDLGPQGDRRGSALTGEPELNQGREEIPSGTDGALRPERPMPEAPGTQEEDAALKARQHRERERAEMERKARLDQERALEQGRRGRADTLSAVEPEVGEAELKLQSLGQEVEVKRQAELAKLARVTMQQAIQIASNQQPGTVLECRLVNEREGVFYYVVIFSGDGTGGTTAHLLISATNGQIIKGGKD